MNDLEIKSVLPDLRRVLAKGQNAVLTAPPGAGKTTGVPLAILDEPWLEGAGRSKRIIMLEPRRLAARAAAHRMASTLGEAVGDTIGYRIRLDSKIGPNTRVEIVTEGILTRMVQHDPSLAEYAIVILDEFHERSLHADLGLALCLEAQRLFRPDLRLLIMSATLDSANVARVLGDAPVISCEGRTFPVETHYLDQRPSAPLERTTAQAIRGALGRESGSVLVFLPGMREIRRVQRMLGESGLGPEVLLAPLHGELPQDEQDAAIAPAPPGRRKVVLSTSIAETSLTIEGVRIVVDAGLMRVPRFDPRSGLSRLETVAVTQDSADQRRGRAGRLEPGSCYRLWTIPQQKALAPRRRPEILEADLTSLMLELALWGASDPAELSWLDPPAPAAVAPARDLLTELGALDDRGRITPHGKRMAELAMHPRLAHMILRAIPLGLAELACETAALLSERDILFSQSGCRNADFRLRLDALHGEVSSHAELEPARARGPGGRVNQGIRRRAIQAARQWHARVSDACRDELVAETKRYPEALDQLGVLLAFAYPDRIAQRQPEGEGRYRLANGSGACFPEPDVLSSEEYLVVADLAGSAHGMPWARISLAAPIQLQDLEDFCEDRIRDTELVSWDDAAQAVKPRRQRWLGDLVLRDQPIENPDSEMVLSALLEGIRRAGIICLPWTRELRHWRARVEFVKRVDGAPSGWPDVSDAALMERLEDWLGPFLAGVTRLAQVRRLDFSGALQRLLSWEQHQTLDRLAPTHLVVPSGSRLRVDYEGHEHPVLAVRLQEMFGCRDTPRLADGNVPVTLHLLSPAGRAVQVTQNLASFWETAYHEVRKELRGRYPKHHWPSDPLSATPTRRTKGKG